MPFGASPVDGSPQQRVSVVGAGRVGSVVGAALRAAGHPVVAVTARSFTSRLRARSLLRGVPIVGLAEAAAAGDLLLLAVGDDALPGLVDELARDHLVPAGTVVVHPSGRHGITVLAPLTAGGAQPLALHPAMIFTGTSEDLPRLTGTGWGVTGDEVTEALAQRLVGDLGGASVLVPEQARAAYHAALAHAANHLTTLVADAASMLADHGVHDPAALLGPLTRAALGAALSQGDGALTGPVVRGDAGTLREHLVTLAGQPVHDSYRAMSRRTTERALAAGRIDARVAERLLQTLAVDHPPSEPVGEPVDETDSRTEQADGSPADVAGVTRLFPVRPEPGTEPGAEPEQTP